MSVQARDQRSPIALWWWSIDRTTLAAAAALLVAGLLLSLAASPAASERYGEPDFYFFGRQCLFAALAFSVALAVSTLSPIGARRLAALGMAGCIIVLALTPLIGHEVGGARRWIRIAGFSLQASEFAKPALIAVTAWLLSRAVEAHERPAALAAAGVFALTALLTVSQPDIGQTALLTACFGAVVFAVGASWRWVLGLVCGGALAGAAAYIVFPHVRERVAGFINPTDADTYQIDLAHEAIARGGLFGAGPGEGVIKQTLPDAHTDFIFAVAAEEFGLIFALAVIAVFGLLTVRLFMRARRLADRESRAVVAGLAALIGVQAGVNIAMTLALTPPKGMTLPFISYGGSSLTAMGLVVGLALAHTRRRPGAYDHARIKA